MKRFLSAGVFSVFVFVSAFLLVAPSEASAQQSKISLKSRVVKKAGKVKKTKSASKRNRGDDIPWEGEMGVSRTTAEIQAEMALLGEARPVRKKREIKKIRPNRQDLPDNPEAPAIEKYPVDPNTKPVKEEDPDSPSLAPQTIGLNFNGGTLLDSLSFPPDTMGDVGPTQYIMAVNGWIRSFNKTTGTADGVLNSDIDVFFNPVRNGVTTTDPRIRYDRLTQKWYIVIINVENTNNRILFAVSNSANITPSTVWTFFFLNHNSVSPVGDAGCFGDYPTLGVDANALYVGTNNFCPSNFGGTTAFVVRKNSIAGAGPIVATAFRGLIPAPPTGAGMYTPQGVDNFDPAATAGYFVAVDNATFSTLKIRRVTDPGGTPTISADLNLTVPVTRFPVSVPHLGNTVPGTDGFLDGLDDRLFQAVIRGGRLYTAHNIEVNAGGVGTSGGGRNGSRWYEIENLATTPTLRQSGTWFDPAASNPKSFWIPSIMASGQGHIALGGSSAGANDRINAATIGRLSTDPLGTLQTTETVTNSTAAYNPNEGVPPGPRRWGDYSYTSVDPEDDMTMWTIQQWNQSTNSYAMRVVKLIAPPPAQPVSASPSTINAGQASVNVTITGTQTGGSGFFDPGAGFVKRIAGSVSGGVTVNSVTYNSPTQVTLNVSTIGAAAGARNVTITNPDGQALTGNNLITINSVAAGLKIPADFDGDAKTDVSQFRLFGAQGQWFVSQSSNGALLGNVFGTAGDQIAPADFDGDNKADVAVFRPSTGTWYLIRSSNQSVAIVQFGLNGDKPTPGDFDGDGKADYGVFRPSDGVWYVTRSSDNGFQAARFGQNGDIPVFGRWDADNKDDLAVFRNGTWFVLNSSNGGFSGLQFGVAGDIPVVGDYDGDSKFDYAVFRPSQGVWYVLRSSDLGFTGLQFGSNGDVPTPGDYDGDGKWDFAVFRPSDTVWYIRRSSNASFQFAQFGLAADKPVPSAYIQ